MPSAIFLFTKFHHQEQSAMGKRKAGGDSGKKAKKYKYSSAQVIEAGWRGVFVTCVRTKERHCKHQVLNMFNSYAEEKFGPEIFKKHNQDDDDEEEGAKDKALSIEDEIAKEIADMKPDSKRDIFTPIDITCECLLFIRMRKPIEPESFVTDICKDVRDGKLALPRHAQRLTPITQTAAANIEGLKTIAKQVLAPHFHKESGQTPVKFAIRPQIRHHKVLTRDQLIQTVAECVGNEHGHSVDLKNPDKVILVECFKSSIGMSVVDEYESLSRFNLEAIHEKSHKL